MAEKVNKSYTCFHYHSLINVCVFYLSYHIAQRRAEALQFMILSRNMRFISWVRSQIRYSSTSMTGGMCFKPKVRRKCMFEHCVCYIIMHLLINIQETRFPIANSFVTFTSVVTSVSCIMAVTNKTKSFFFFFFFFFFFLFFFKL